MAQEITPAGSFYPVFAPQPEKGGLGDAAKQLLFVFFKWKFLILSLFLLFPLGAAIGLYLEPPVGRASAMIMLKGDRMPLQMTGAASANTRWAYSPQVMQSEVELIRSRQVMIPVAKTLLSQSEEPDESQSSSWLSLKLSDFASWFLALIVEPGQTTAEDETEETAAQTIERTTAKLIKNTVAVAITDTNVLRVTHYDESSEGAKDKLDLIIDQYMEEQAIIQTGAATLLKFFEREKNRVETELLKAEETLGKWQEKNRTVSIGEEITGQLRLLNQRENGLQETEGQIEMTKAKIDVLKKQLASSPERQVTIQERIGNPLATKLKEQLVTAEVALQDLLQRYTEKSRQVLEKKAQVALLRKELEAAEKQEIIGRETTEPNPLRGALERDLANAQALMASLVPQRETLVKQVRDTSENLAAQRDKKDEVGRMSRQVALHKDSFELYSKRLEEARIAAGLGKEHLAQAAIIAQPYTVPNEDSFNDIGMVFLAAMVGVVLAMAIGFGFEILNNKVRTQEDVEHYLALPMLAAVPELPARPLMLNQ